MTSQMYTFERRVTREEEKAYLEIQFDMPENVEELRVSCRVESEGSSAAVIDLGVRDAERVRGWSGGARTEFAVGREQATPGYIPGPLTPGNWAVLHNAYRVPPEGCRVTVTVECRLETPRWLKGDLHMHSVHSDGKFTLEENAKIMAELGCDFLAMTDHNAMSQNLAYPRNNGIVMIPGMEFTTNFGHGNFLGIADPLDDFRVKEQDDVNRRIRTARERGAKVVLNHPHCRNCGWLWDFGVEYDWVEVWNGALLPEDNELTLAWWQQRLTEGKRIVAVGGSDSHAPHPRVKHSRPTNWVYSRSKTVQGILEAIDQGHVVLSISPDGPFMQLQCGSSMVGDLVPAEESSDGIELTASRLQAGDVLLWISDRGMEREISVSESGEFSIRLPREDRIFYRAEVWRDLEDDGRVQLAALTNPVYFHSRS